MIDLGLGDLGRSGNKPHGSLHVKASGTLLQELGVEEGVQGTDQRTLPWQ
jgi:hypothetical protein